MKKLFFFCIACGAAVWFVWFQPPVNAPDATVSPAIAMPSLRLSRFVEGQIDAILGPLDSTPAPLPRQELRAVIEQFRDESLHAPSAEQPAYKIGIALCNALIAAVGGREQGLLQLQDSKAKENIQYDRFTGRPSSNRAFFDDQINQRWAKDCAARRSEIDLLYAQLREIERRRNLIK